jgi:hypothetical protein
VIPEQHTGGYLNTSTKFHLTLCYKLLTDSEKKTDLCLELIDPR